MSPWSRWFPIMAAGLLAFAWSAGAQDTQTFDAAGLRTLRIKNLTGNITVSAQEGARVLVTATKRDFTDACTLTVARTGEVLALTVDKPETSSAQCGVDFDIRMPKEIGIDAVNGSGKLNVQATAGKLNFKWGSGDITARGAFAEVMGTSGSGNVTVIGLLGSGGLRSGSGDVWVDFMTAPTPGALEVRAGSGDVEVRMPTGTKIAARLVAGSGRIVNDLGDDPSAEYFVSVQVGSGNVRLTSN